jgi:hypothetical protein
MYLNYRGSWGSPGDFSFTHCIEDTQSAIAYLHDAGKAAKLRSDPNTIVLIAHSMGGFVALTASPLPTMPLSTPPGNPEIARSTPFTLPLTTPIPTTVSPYNKPSSMDSSV